MRLSAGELLDLFEVLAQRGDILEDLAPEVLTDFEVLEHAKVHRLVSNLISCYRIVLAPLGEAQTRKPPADEARYFAHCRSFVAAVIAPDRDTCPTKPRLPDSLAVKCLTRSEGMQDYGRDDPRIRITAFASFVESAAHLLADPSADLLSLAYSYGASDAVVEAAQKCIAQSSVPRVLRLKSGRTGQAPSPLRMVLEGHTDGVLAATFSRDESSLFTSGDEAIRAWDVESGRLTAVLAGHESRVADLAVTADGKRLFSVSWDGTFRAWDFRRGEPLFSYRRYSPQDFPDTDGLEVDPDKDDDRLAVTPCGQLAIFTVNGHVLELFDVRRRRPIARLRGHKSRITDVAISFDGSTAASIDKESNVIAWDIWERKSRFVLEDELYGSAKRVPHHGFLSPAGNAVAINADGSIAVSANHWEEGYAVNVWELGPGELRCRLRVPSEIRALWLSDLGREMASMDQHGILTIWDLESSQPERQAAVADERPMCLAVGARTRLAVTGSGATEDHAARLWDLSQLRQAAPNRMHVTWVQEIDVSDDGHVAVSRCRGERICVWELTRFTCVRTVDWSGPRIVGSQLTGDGRYLVLGDEGGCLSSIDTNSGAIVSQERLSQEAISTLAVGDGLVATSDVKGQVSVLAVQDGRIGELLCRRNISFRGDAIGVTKVPVGLAVCGGGRLYRMWGQTWEQAEDDDITVEGSVLAMSRDGRYLCVGRGAGTYVVLDVETGTETRLGLPTLKRPAVAFSRNGKLLLIKADRHAALCDVATGAVVGQTDLPSAVDGIRVTEDGTRIVCYDTGDRGLCAIDMKDGRTLSAVPGPGQEWIASVELSPDGGSCLQVTRFRRRAVEIDLERDIVYQEYEQPGGEVGCAVFTSDGGSVVTGPESAVKVEDYSIRLWDRRTGKCLKLFWGHRGAVRAVDVSRDGRWIVSAGDHPDRTVRVWDLASGQCVFKTPRLTSSPHDVALSIDGDRVAVTEWDSALSLWKVSLGRQLWRVPIRELCSDESNGENVETVAFSPRGDLLVIGTGDRSWTNRHNVRIFRAETGEELLCLDGHTDWVTCVRFTPDGSHVVSAGKDRTVRVWSIKKEKLVAKCELMFSIVSLSGVRPDGTVLCGTVSREVIPLKLQGVELGSPIVWGGKSFRLSREFSTRQASSNSPLAPLYGEGEDLPGRTECDPTSICPHCGQQVRLDCGGSAARPDYRDLVKQVCPSCDSAFQVIIRKPLRLGHEQYVDAFVYRERHCLLCAGQFGGPYLDAGMTGGRLIGLECLDYALGAWREHLHDFEGDPYCDLCSAELDGPHYGAWAAKLCPGCATSLAEQVAAEWRWDTWPRFNVKNELTIGVGERPLRRLVAIRAFLALRGEKGLEVEALVDNIGYDDEDPLSFNIRKAAIETCVRVGTETLPYVFDRLADCWHSPESLIFQGCRDILQGLLNVDVQARQLIAEQIAGTTGGLQAVYRETLDNPNRNS